MTKTLVVDDTQRKALLFLLGGRHNTQLEPHQKAALDEVETELRDVPIEAESVVAPDQGGTVSLLGEAPAAAPVPAPKAKRGRK